MDGRDSFDQFEGLPLELWAAQQLGADHMGPGHAPLPSALYHGGHSTQVSREHAAQNLPLPFVAGICFI